MGNKFNALSPVPLVTSCDKALPCSTSDIVTFDQNWHHLYSTSVREKDLSSDTQIWVISSMEPEIYMKVLGNLSEKLQAKFRGTTCGYSTVKIVCLDDAFSEFMQLEGSLVEGNHGSKKKRIGEKERTQKIKNKTTKTLRCRSLSCLKTKVWFLCMAEQNCYKNAMLVERKDAVMLQMPFLVDRS